MTAEAAPQAYRPSMLLVGVSNRDLPTVRTLLQRQGNYTVHVAAGPAAALALAARQGFDVVLCDLTGGDGRGAQFVADVHQQGYRGAVVVLGEASDKQMAMAALSAGAYEYLPKDGQVWNALPSVLVRATRFGRVTRRLNELEATVTTLRGQVEEVNRTDPLTGLFKAAYITELYERELKRLRRYGGVLAMVEARIYNLPAVRETAGPPAADDVVRGLAAILTRALRATDLVGYVGEGRFVLLLPSTDVSGVRVVIARLEKAVEEANERAPKRPEMKASFTMRGAGGYDDLVKAR